MFIEIWGQSLICDQHRVSSYVHYCCLQALVKEYLINLCFCFHIVLIYQLLSVELRIIAFLSSLGTEFRR